MRLRGKASKEVILQQVSGTELWVQTTLPGSREVTVKFLGGFCWFAFLFLFILVMGLFLLSPSFKGVCCLNRVIVFIWVFTPEERFAEQKSFHELSDTLICKATKQKELFLTHIQLASQLQVFVVITTWTNVVCPNKLSNAHGFI